MWWKEGQVGRRRHVVPLIPFFLIGITLGITTVERHMVGAEGEAFAFTWADRVLIAGRALCFYLGKLVWPVNLTLIYPQWAIDRSAWWQYLAAMRKRLGRAPRAAALFFAGTLVPALGFFNREAITAAPKVVSPSGEPAQGPTGRGRPRCGGRLGAEG